MRSLTIILGLILLSACKQFTLSEADQKVLAESEQLLNSSIYQTEKWTIQRIHDMNSRVSRSGNRPEDVQEINQSMDTWKSYQDLADQIKNSKERLPSEIVNGINLYDLETAQYDEEMKQRTSLPLIDMPFWSNVQLNQELVWNMELIIDYHQRRTGNCICFDMVKLIRVISDSKIKFYLLTHQHDQLYQKLTIPEFWQNTVEFKELSEWINQEFRGEILSVTYYDESGEIVSKQFEGLVEIQFIQ